MTKYDNWKILVGDHQYREWNSREYRFYTSANQQEEMKVIESLQSQTPIRFLIEETVSDIIIRAITFLSYYNINPTFNNKHDEVGTGFFWFPLDRLDDEKYELLSEIMDSYENGDMDDEEDDDDEDSALSDFPVMSTVSEPVIDAAISDSYISKVDRVSVERRKQRLEEEIKDRRRERIEEFEEWLEDGLKGGHYPKNLSVFAEVVGRLPAYILLELINEERDRIDNIYNVFDNIGGGNGEVFEGGPEFLLQKLNSLSDEYPVFDSPTIEAFCLDQYSRECDYHVTKSRGRKVENTLEDCEHCGSKLFRIYRTGLDERVKDAWMMGLLPELVVARLLLEAEWTEEVIPHRMIQMEQEDGNITSGVEVDICVHTTDDEVILFEVTSQTDALSRLTKKRDKLDEAGIEYDALVQVGPINNERMVPFGDRVASAGGWMIKGLESEEFEETLRDTVENLS